MVKSSLCSILPIDSIWRPHQKDWNAGLQFWVINEQMIRNNISCPPLQSSIDCPSTSLVYPEKLSVLPLVCNVGLCEVEWMIGLNGAHGL